ncbi:granulins [Lingula anatina]|uniref:Granulins n=1 Tax=Lingula anatina TaxID=7574 RepID=A0A1S3IW57_LINAN|nr:granulins [Lingula anatina]|eukprot:XP_013402422.1 granulins [Lingula anatina]
MKQLYLLFIAVLPLAAASTLFFESHKTSLHEGRNQPCPPETDAGCPLGATCCHLVTGFAVCCQGENAVCCPNSLHCCPAGHKCDEGTGLCTSGDPHLTAMWTDMFFPPKQSEEKFSSKAEEPAPKREPPSREGKMISCPDQKEQCPDNSTCCAAKAGGYGCCPTINAVCCADKVYCCPPGHMCEGGGGCELNDTRAATLGLVHFNKAPGQKIMKTKTPTQVPDASPILKESSISPDSVVASDVRCPDGQTACPSGNTCCKLASGQYGCCPVPKAVCCKDGVHCCPDGYTCDVRAGTCHSQNSVISWFTKTSAKTFKEKVGSVMCPDGQSECPNGNTCCRLASGQYGCCPVPDAVCCKDGVHCCPNGFTCQTTTGECVQETKAISVIPDKAVLVDTNVGIVMCPDGQSQCPDGNTCCKLPSGQYGCCPVPDAVCCKDGVHCCPNGFTCQTTTGVCVQETKAISLIPDKAVLVDTNVGIVICPDGQSQCPDGNTCCKLPSGQYGCCPVPDAVCCKDGVHCCPNGHTCDVSAGTCHLQNSVMSWLTKTPAKMPSENVGIVMCPDGQTQCPNGNTCCKLPSGQYGCCPVPDAVCCKDGVHCCPNGFTCQTTTGECVQETKAISVIPDKAVLVDTNVGIVMCPDGQSQCPDGNTCCKLPSGQYGCCPVPDAVCCKDGVHCCPNGFTCQTTTGECVQETKAISVIPDKAVLVDTNVGIVMCPDGQSQCPDGNTCCKLPSGQYGCCPVPDAVCCKDGVHCCPNGFTCQTTTGECVQETKAISVIPDKAVLVDTNVGIVMCPDGQSQCPDGNTCCKLPSGQYGCCPVPDAVCCKDGVHCCPNGFTCQTTTGVCVQETKAISVIPDKAVLVDTNVGIVICPDGQSQCPDGNTCCKLPSGQYGCCPVPDAVCCKDGVHCCPNGFTCQTTTGVCVQGTKAISVIPDKAVLVDTNVGIVICPDGQSQCPDGNTCCKLPSGQYGCCPVPHALCCKDGVHCCIDGLHFLEGYECDVSKGSCKKSGQGQAKIMQKLSQREAKGGHILL